MATERFTMKSFGLHFIASVTRVSGDFLRTAWGLLRHPWIVVRDYVYGRRVGLVSPVAMLLLLSLYWGIFMAVVPHFSQSDQLQSVKLGALLKWLYGSVTFQYLFLTIPVAVSTWGVYYNDIRQRFNFAELLMATLYLASTYLLVNFILSPIEIVHTALGDILILGVTGVYGIISVLKAFPQPTKGKAIIKLTILMAVCGLLLLIFLTLFALPLFGKLS